MPNIAVDKIELHSLVSQQFYDSLNKYIDYNKPDPIARRQLECWELNWSDGDVCLNDIISCASWGEKKYGMQHLVCSPENYVGGTLEIRGDYVAVTLEISCIWADGDAAKNSIVEDGKLNYICRLKSGQFVERKDDESKTETKIRKKMISRLRQDSYISNLLEFTEENKHSANFCLAEANIYVDAKNFKLEERVDLSESTAETLRRALWPSTTSSLDVSEVILALPSLPCRNTGGVTTGTTRLANRAKLRLLEDAMVDECEKEGDDRLIEDLIISKNIEPYQDGKEALCHGESNTTQQEKKKFKR